MQNTIRTIMFSLATMALTVSSPLLADQSSITEADGQSCLGDDKSRKQTQNVALQDAKRLALEYAGSYLESETVVENFQLKSDLIKAFKSAEVKVIEILEESWVEGDCYTIRIKAEVIPSKGVMKTIDTTMMLGDPRAPLNVKITTNKDSYETGDNMRIYLQGNKPFYARLIYVDADSNNIQILPNQHRSDNYFAGVTIFEVPERKDQFVMKVGAPYGKESLTLYASTAPLGTLSITAANADVYLVQDAAPEIARRTRGISLTKVTQEDVKQAKSVAEFSEATVQITTSTGS
jgi:hypothetical protein